MSDNFEVGGENLKFRSNLPFWTEVHRRRTNHMWPFQHYYEMHAHAHCRACAKQTFVVKKFLKKNCRKWPFVSLDKTPYSSAGIVKSCIETAIWTFNLLATIEVHYMEKNLGIYS